MSWVSVKAITGGQVVSCALCGKRVCRETFWADDTNYAEAFRLATAFAWHHEHSDEHKAALKAFHSEPPEESPEELELRQIFNVEPRTLRDRRREAARGAARAISRRLRDDTRR